MDPVGKNGNTLSGLGRSLDVTHEVVAIKEVIPQDEATVVICNEFLCDNKGLGQPLWSWLFRIMEGKTNLLAIAEESFK
jgi:hypothetical protein